MFDELRSFSFWKSIVPYPPSKLNLKMFSVQSRNQWMKSSKNLVERIEGENYSFRKELYSFLNNTVCHTWRHLAQVDRTHIERWERYLNFGRKIEIYTSKSDVVRHKLHWIQFPDFPDHWELSKLRTKSVDNDSSRHCLPDQEDSVSGGDLLQQ